MWKTDLNKWNKMIINTTNLIKDYSLVKVKVRALNGVDMSIEEGEFVAIMGPSGSGKSTLMHILGCLDSPTEGDYHLDGVQVSELDKNELALIRNRKIGFVFQSFNLLPHLNVLKNVELPLMYAGSNANQRNQKAREILDSVGLSDRLKHKPAELSGGQRQRVAIARALVTEHDILLLDDPFKGLDGEMKARAAQIILRYGAEKTVILVTHDPQDAVLLSAEVFRLP